MKKYFPLILFFCFGHFLKLNAQSNFINLTPGDRFLSLDFAGSINNVIDVHSMSNYHFFNPYVFNPAMAGIADKRQLNLDWNRQYNHAASMSFEQPIISLNSAIGIQYEYSIKNFGKMHRYGLAYNYGFRWKENSQLRIGVQFSQINVKSDRSYYLQLETDKWHHFPTFDLGIAYQYKKLRLGLSVQNLVPTKFDDYDEWTESFINKVDTERTVNFSTANTFRLAKNWDWSFAFLLRFNSHDIIDDENYYYRYYETKRDKNQHDFSTYLSFQKKYMIGTTLRTQFDPAWIGFVGLQLKEKLNLQFSFNMKKDEYLPRFWEALTQYQF